MRFISIHIISIILLASSAIYAQNDKILISNGIKQDTLNLTCFKQIYLEIDTASLDSFKITSVRWYSDSLMNEIASFEDFRKVELIYIDSFYRNQKKILVMIDATMMVEDPDNPGMFIDSIMSIKDSIVFKLNHRINDFFIDPPIQYYQLYQEIVGGVSLDTIYNQTNASYYEVGIIKNDLLLKNNSEPFFNDTLKNCQLNSYYAILGDIRNNCLTDTSNTLDIYAEIPIPHVAGDTLICPGELIVLVFENESDFVPGYSTKWYFNNSLFATDINEIPLESGGRIYLRVEYPMAEGCVEQSVEILVKEYLNVLSWSVDSSPEFLLLSDSIIKLCENETTIIQASLSIDADYEWIYNGLSINFTDNYNFDWRGINDDNIDLLLIARDGKCEFETNIKLIKSPKPSGQLTRIPDSPICAYEDLELSFSAKTGRNFRWVDPTTADTDRITIDSILRYRYNGSQMPIKLSLKDTIESGLICSADIFDSLDISKTPKFADFLDTLFVCPDQNLELEIPFVEFNNKTFWDSISWTVNSIPISLGWNDTLRFSQGNAVSGVFQAIAIQNNVGKNCFDTLTFFVSTDVPSELGFLSLNGPFYKGQQIWLVIRHPFDSLFVNPNLPDFTITRLNNDNGFLYHGTIPQDFNNTSLEFTVKNKQDCLRSANYNLNIQSGNCSFPEIDTIFLQAFAVTQPGSRHYGLQIMASPDFFEENSCYTWGRIRKDFSGSQEIFTSQAQNNFIPWFTLSSLDTSQFFYWVDVSHDECSNCKRRLWLGGDEAVLKGRAISIDVSTTSEYFMNVFPNPTSGNFRVSVPNSNLKVTWTIMVYNTMGKPLQFLSNIEGKQLVNGIDISLTSMPSVYLIQAISNEGDVITSKILKQ